MKYSLVVMLLLAPSQALKLSQPTTALQIAHSNVVEAKAKTEATAHKIETLKQSMAVQ